MAFMTLAAIALLLSAAQAQNWPQFRGPEASGIGAGSPPVEWNGESGKNILWKTEIPGLGHSSPVIWGDRIFLTTAISAKGAAPLKVGLYGDIKPVEDEGPQKLIVYCLDRKSGKILWQQTSYSGPLKFKRHPKSTNANPTPATDGKHLVVFFGSEGLYTYDMDGKLLWKKHLGPLDAGFYMVPLATWGFASSPILHDGMAIVQADVQKDSFLAAFDAASGKELWRTPRKDVPTFGSPAIAPYTANGQKSLQVVVNGWKHAGGYDLKTGKELWMFNGTTSGGDIPVPTPVSKDGLILITSAHGPGRPILAFRTNAAGTVEKESPSLAWTVERAGNYMQTPLIDGDLAYFCMDKGILTVFQLSNGERIYQQRLGSGGGFSSSPVAAGGRLYITSEDGATIVLAEGKEFNQLAKNELGETVMATPAISGGVLYIRGRNHLFAIGK